MKNNTDIMKYTKELLSGNMKGAYLLVGKEEFLKNHFLSDVAGKLFADETEKMFNFVKIDGSVISKNELMTAFDTPPQLSENKLAVLYNVDFAKLKGEDEEIFFEAARSATEYDYLTYIVYTNASELLFDYDRRTLSAKLSKFFTVVNFEPLSKQRLAKWIINHFKAVSLGIENDAVDMLAENNNCDMLSILNDIKKLSSFVESEGRSTVTANDIDKISTKTIVFDSFFFSNAISKKDYSGMLSYIRDCRTKKIDTNVVLAQISKYVCDMIAVKSGIQEEQLTTAEIASDMGMKEYPVRLMATACEQYTQQQLEEIMLFCYDADKKIKTGTGGYELLEIIVSML